MKKIFLLALCFILISASTTFAGAAEDFLSRSGPTVGIVIVGGSDFRTPDYYGYIDKTFTAKDKKKYGNYKIVSGNDMQSKYLNFWTDKGFLEEQFPKKQDFLDFVKYSGYGKVLFLMVKDPVTDKHSRTAGIFGTVAQTRTSVQINAFLCDGSDIVKTYTAIKEDDSEWSDLRAKRGAFEKAIRDIAEQLIPYLGK